MKKFLALLGAVVCHIAVAAGPDVDVRIPVDSLGFPEAVPVFVTGYSGEVDRILRFDLSFMGFEIVSDKNAARYIIQKNNAPGVGAQVTDPLANKIPYNRAFGPMGTARQQTHALADDLCKTLLPPPYNIGIALTRIAFVAQPLGYGNGEIYVADFDGFNASPVTRDGTIVHTPAWAGKTALIYTSFKLANKADLLWHDIQSGQRRPFARFPGQNVSPAVSRDGKRVAMILSKSGSPDLWVSDANGGNLKQLTTTKEDESSPTWSPDGTRICYSSRVSGLPSLYIVSANGGTPRRLPVGSSPTEADWSPDGKFIICTTQSRSGFQLVLLPLEGPGANTPVTLAQGEDPVWAPNSRAVLFARTMPNHRRVLSLIDVPSKTVKDLAPINGSAAEPAWAR